MPLATHTSGGQHEHSQVANKRGLGSRAIRGLPGPHTILPPHIAPSPHRQAQHISTLHPHHHRSREHRACGWHQGTNSLRPDTDSHKARRQLKSEAGGWVKKAKPPLRGVGQDTVAPCLKYIDLMNNGYD